MAEIYERNTGYNMGLEFLKAHELSYNQRQGSKANLIEQLEVCNLQLKDLSKLSNALTNRKESKKANFDNDGEMRVLIDRIREAHRDQGSKESIIPNDKYSWNSENEIQNMIDALNDQSKIIAGQVNQHTMHIQQEFQDALQITDIANKSIEMLTRHIESILRKIRG